MAFAATVDRFPRQNPLARVFARLMQARAQSPALRAVDAAPARAPRILLGRHLY